MQSRKLIVLSLSGNLLGWCQAGDLYQAESQSISMQKSAPVPFLVFARPTAWSLVRYIYPRYKIVVTS